VFASIWEKTEEGEEILRFHQLKVDHGSPEAEGYYVRYLFNLPWTVGHPMDNDSPLFGMTAAEFRESGVEIVVVLEGIDPITSNSLQIRWPYPSERVIWGHVFLNTIKRTRPDPSGVSSMSAPLSIFMENFHRTIPQDLSSFN